MAKNILYIRNFASKVNPALYNLQEIGFGKALIKQGYNCDIIYYSESKEEKIDTVYTENERILRIHWLNGYKVMSNSIYTKILNKNFLNQYEIVITTEYNQIMTYLLSRLCPEKLVLYHGPYADNNNLFIRNSYDSLLLPGMRKSIAHNFVKSDLANEYLKNKGFKNVTTIGVGLDRSNIELEKATINDEITKKLVPFKGKRKLLYIGILEERRNIIFLLSVLNYLINQNEEFYLIIVGKGNERDTKSYWSFIEENKLNKYIIYFEKVEQKDLWQIYESSDLMLFPTKYDIFGMVLLESMLFKVPVISSVNGGSSTIIKNNVNGFIIEQFDEKLWGKQIKYIVENPTFIEQIKMEQSKTIELFTWDAIVTQVLREIAL